MDIEEYPVLLLTPVENRLQQEKRCHKRTSQKHYDQVCKQTHVEDEHFPPPHRF